MLGSIRKLTGQIKTLPWWLLSCLLPFGQIITIVKLRRLILDKAAEGGKQVRLPLLPLILLSCVFFLLPLNIVTLAILQSAVNKLNREAVPAEVTA